MSRHTVRQSDPHLTIVVGWDNPMQTYFSHIYDDRIPPNRTDCVFAVGVREGELRTPVDLAIALASWVDLPVGLLQQLWEDEQDSLPRTALQEQMLRLFR
jgi:hypothetical protein